MKHIPYENGFIHQERPECPIDEVINETIYRIWPEQEEEAWENNDLYVSGNRVDNQDKD